MIAQRRQPLRRFVVADRSMEPTLVEGQGLITTGYGRPKPGQLRCFEHPERPGFWVVKRVQQVHQNRMDLTSDNPVGTRFRDVPVENSYRVLLAIPRRFM
ncbi:MAG: hypothetical protein MUE31_00395 [Candidatus Nanopelagicales bacterium]|nr:hypothetical protein [Candidatus Nanopelagicales bacterium]